ncbi:hypothetical protein T492DRAFT_895526 [Pavlovales sp. CCMP2436]|nr:hypothetical protein T492DRAFT_895526 [Pavlovales sp. CCMP2436]
MSKPAPRDPLWLPQYDDGAYTAVGAIYRWDERNLTLQPVYTLAGPTTSSGHSYSTNAFRCRESRPSAAPFQEIVAGQTTVIEWDLPANHPGDCYLYLSYDTEVDEPEHFIKIAEFPGCVDKAVYDAGFDGRSPPIHGAWPVTMPTWLASCEHCVLRWEWISLHQTVSPVIAISSPFGHLPSTTDACTAATKGNCYRRAYNGEKGSEYLLQPDLASTIPLA